MSATYDSLIPLPPGYDDPIPSGPNPAKPDQIYVYHEDKGAGDSYFTAYSVEDDGTISEYDKIYIPSPIGEEHSYNASCNGLFYFPDCSGEGKDFLWNPTTNELKMMSKSRTEKIKILPNGESVKPSFRVRHIPQGCVMWSDNASQDCFVVRFLLVDVVYPNGEEVYCDYQLDLYSLKTDLWERIPTTPHGLYGGELGVCINGFYFCQAYDESSCYILSLDLSTRTLSRIPLPRDDIEIYRVIDYNGLLSIIVSSSPLGLSKYHYSLWVWHDDDGLWKRESVFEANQYVYPYQKHFKIGELLYFRDEDDQVMVIHQLTRKWKRLPVLDDITFCPFVESTMRLNNTTSSFSLDQATKKEKRQSLDVV